MPIYMKYGAIEGDATAAGHEGWIELNSFQWGVGRGISSPTGKSANRESTAPSIAEVSVSKVSDFASPLLLIEALKGEGTPVQIDFCKTDGGQLEVFTSVALENTLISGFSTSR